MSHTRTASVSDSSVPPTRWLCALTVNSSTSPGLQPSKSRATTVPANAFISMPQVSAGESAEVEHKDLLGAMSRTYGAVERSRVHPRFTGEARGVLGDQLPDARLAQSGRTGNPGHLKLRV